MKNKEIIKLDENRWVLWSYTEGVILTCDSEGDLLEYLEDCKCVDLDTKEFLVNSKIYGAKLECIEEIMTYSDNEDDWDIFYNWKKEVLCSVEDFDDYCRTIDNKLNELLEG